MWQLCSKDYPKVNYYVDVKLTYMIIGMGTSLTYGELKGNHNYPCEAIRNAYLEEKNKIMIIVHNHLHGIDKKMMDKQLCQNQCSADVCITTITDQAHVMLLTRKLLNQELKS